MEWLITYCVVCWGASLYWVLKSNIVRDVQDEAECDAETANRSVAATAIFAPLIVPFVMLVCIPCLIRHVAHVWRCMQARRVHTDPELTPVNMLKLPKSVRNWYESQTPFFFEHAFRMLEDVRWLTEPVQIDIRAFIAEEGDIFGSIFAAVENTGDGEEWLLLAMTSILQDGTVVETSSMSSDRLDVVPQAKDGYIVAFAPENTVNSVLETHLEALEDSGQMVKCFAPEQFRDVKIYGNRVWSHWKHRTGEIKETPPEAILLPAFELSDPVIFSEPVGV
jgi:hypothetical protein